MNVQKDTVCIETERACCVIFIRRANLFTQDEQNGCKFLVMILFEMRANSAHFLLMKVFRPFC